MSETRLLSHYIDGRWESAAPAFDSLNPSDTRDAVARVPGDDGTAVAAAVAAAKAALPAWSSATIEFRSDVLDRVGSTILARREELGRLMSREEGKTLPESIGEVVRAGRIFKFFAGEALRMRGETVGSTRPEIDTAIYR